MTRAECDALVVRARAARQRAYAPYSKYLVGAALLGVDGVIYEGCNVENASYGGTICAERTAVVRAVASGCREFRAIAITTSSPKPAPPCGFCLQVMSEFASDLPIILSAPKGAWKLTSIRKLLPMAFVKKDL
ncbi:MAG: cytidine deaminase [Planctomycetes bacterium]|nr:cytidine deaminase [Planctomycetota bacterium]MBI3847241.1 cytidine deaminase [Planctomycetota bacterium]